MAAAAATMDMTDTDVKVKDNKAVASLDLPLTPKASFEKKQESAQKTSKDPAATDKPKDAKPIAGLDDEAPKQIKLGSKDKKEFLVDKKSALISNLIKTALENDDKAEEIPILGVEGHILERILCYMTEHKGVEPPLVEKPLRSKVMKDVCCHKWDADFIDKVGENRQNLYDLILAANYMDIKSLLHLGCAKVASMIKGQPLEKIKEILDPKVGSNVKASGDSKASSDAKSNNTDDGKSNKTDDGKTKTQSNAKPAAAAAAAAALGDDEKKE